MFRRQANEHKTFIATVDSHSREVDVALSRRHEEMGQEWDDVDKGWQDLGKQMAKVGITKPAASDKGLLWLNVGGSEVSIRRCVLKRKSELPTTTCTLADLFRRGTWDKRLPRDSDGRIVLDESPACVKHILYTLLKTSGKGDLDVAVALDSDAPTDEKPNLSYVSRALGLPDFVIGMAVTGGSIVLEANNVALLTATIQGWCPGQQNALKLLYRASRDGWTGAAFHARCGGDSPSTITLIRVRGQGSGSSDSIVGGFSSVPWTGGDGYHASPGAFLFMLKDGSVSGPTPFQPAKWDVMHGQDANAIYRYQGGYGPAFGSGPALRVAWALTTATLIVNNRTYDVGSAFVGLNNRAVVEIETFRVCSMETTPLPVLAEPAGSTAIAVADPTPFSSPTASAEEHSDDIHKFGELIAGSLMEERMALWDAQIELVEARDKVTACANALAAVYGPGIAAGKEDPVVELSVRGNRVTTLLSTLQACPESFLATKFNEDRWPATDKDVDEHGRRLIDCSPSVFAKVLDVLRMRKRAAWGVTSSHQGGDELVRVIIKEGERDSFEEFIEKNFPGNLQRFIMDCVEPTPESDGP